MKYIVAMWAAPVVLFWGWFFLSFNDINFGSVFLTRDLHDLVFQLYGEMLGVDPATIPVMVADACIFDACLLMAIWAFRRRREIAGWVRARLEHYRLQRRLERYLSTGSEPEVESEPIA